MLRGQFVSTMSQSESTAGIRTRRRPAASGLFLDPDNDRLVVRIADFNLGVEEWWSFQFSTGEPVGICQPKELMADPDPVSCSLDARPVAGTSLTLVHWRREEARANRDGARFTLVDPTGKSVWSLDWPSDYRVPNDEKAEIQLWKELHEHGAILRCDQRGQFDLWCGRDAEQVTFSVRPDEAGKCLVNESNREPYVRPVKTEPPPVAIPDWRPHVLGRITLRLPELEPAGSLRDANGFTLHVELLDCAVPDGRHHWLHLRGCQHDDDRPCLRSRWPMASRLQARTAWRACGLTRRRPHCVRSRRYFHVREHAGWSHTSSLLGRGKAGRVRVSASEVCYSNLVPAARNGPPMGLVR